MFRSMTAYGRSQINDPICEVSLEITSLNRKHLEIRLNLPKELSRFEPHIRKLFDKKVERGMISVNIQVRWKNEHPLEIHPNLPLIKKYVGMRKELEEQLKLKSDDAALMDWVFKQEGTLIVLEDETKEQKLQKILDEAFEKGFGPFFAMKEREGQSILEDLMDRLKILEEKLSEVRKLAPNVVERYKERIAKVLAEFATASEDKERLIKEAALFADRIDITEEITRFSLHLQHLKELATSNEVFIGKTIDFILQEMMREANTMTNKAQEHAISTIVVTMKAELEKIREQIQNVE